MLVDSHQESADGKVHAHIARARTYYIVFGCLIFLTLTTSAVSYVHLGEMNLVVAILIATMKASLVILFFMHMKDETKFNALIFVSALLFFGIFLAYTTNDTNHRGQITADNGGRIDPRTGQFANGTPPALIAEYKLEQKQAEEAAAKAVKAGEDKIGSSDPLAPEKAPMPAMPAAPTGAAAPAAAAQPQGSSGTSPTNDAQKSNSSKPAKAAGSASAPAPGAGP